MSTQEVPNTDPVRARLIQAAYTLVSNEGVDALTVRRLAEAAGASTMVVYSRFDGLGGVTGAVCEQGFMELGDALATVADDDPVVALMLRGLAYVDFASANPNLYKLMFQYTSDQWSPGRRQVLVEHGSPTDSVAGRRAFSMILDSMTTGAPDGVPDEILIVQAGVLWSAVHGVAMLSIAGHLSGVDDNVVDAMLVTLAVGAGMDADTARAALEKAHAAMAVRRGR